MILMNWIILVDVDWKINLDVKDFCILLNKEKNRKVSLSSKLKKKYLL